jgi:hypothetical protein
MAQYSFVICGVIKAEDSASAKMFITEALTDMHMPTTELVRPVEGLKYHYQK